VPNANLEDRIHSLRASLDSARNYDDLKHVLNAYNEITSLPEFWPSVRAVGPLVGMQIRGLIVRLPLFDAGAPLPLSQFDVGRHETTGLVLGRCLFGLKSRVVYVLLPGADKATLEVGFAACGLARGAPDFLRFNVRVLLPS
jgi:hypothetical protein